MSVLRIKEVLTEKGVTGKDLANKIGLTETSISRIVKGDQYPKIETLIAIASALDVDVKDLFVSTKEGESLEPFYVKRNGELVQIGEIDLGKAP